MHMKTKTSATMMVVLLAAVTSMFAVVIRPFTSWDDITKKSPDIIIARCSASTPDPTPIGNGMVLSDIEVALVLKGDTKPGAARMNSQYWPRQGEQFLMFSTYQSNRFYRAYNAIETYRVVPLGRYFLTNGLTGKPLDAQIQFVLRHRLEELSQEMQKGAEEKKRLEEAIKK